MNPMRELHVTKVVLNIGVGEAGERLSKAEAVLKKLTDGRPVRTLSRHTNRDLGIRKGQALGCKVTLRGEAAHKAVREALWVRENRLYNYCFSTTGGLSFGIPDYTSYEHQKYDPDIGIFGLDLAIVVERPGCRVARRKLRRGRIPLRHRVSRDECMDFMQRKFNVEVV